MNWKLVLKLGLGAVGAMATIASQVMGDGKNDNDNKPEDKKAD